MQPNLIESAKEIFYKTCKPGFIMLSVYDELVKEGEIETIEEQGQSIIEQTEIRMEAEAGLGGFASLKEYRKNKKTLFYPKQLENECKRQTVANYFIKLYEIENF